MNGNAGKWIIIAGFIVIVIGVIVYFFNNKLHWIGNLPGDIKIEKENFRFYFPLTTMLLVSLLINVIIRIVKWLN
jgi:H+/Cl- antiporter ClcA